MSFASNLLGAMVGGALEYVALVTGYQQLAWLVAGLYLAAYAAVRWVPAPRGPGPRPDARSPSPRPRATPSARHA